MRRVLIVSEFFPPDPGGIQRSLDLLRPAWGDDVRVITPVEQGYYSGQRRSLFSGRFRPRWSWLIPEFWRQARNGRRLIVFGHYSAAVMAAWLLKPVGVRYVILAHGNDVLQELPRLFGFFVRYHLRGADWIGVNSRWLADRLNHMGVPCSRLIKTHPAVADDEGGPNTGSVTRLLTIARLVPRKNIATVLQAVAILKKDWPDLHYDIVGDGPEHERLQMLATSLDLEKNVTWRGRADEPTRQRLLKEAGIFVLTPIVLEQGADIEGLGAVFLEAGAAGLPIVASNTGGISDVVIDRVTGIFIDPGSANSVADGIRILFKAPDLCRRYSEAARSLVNNEFRSSIRSGRASMMLNGVPTNQQPKISIIIPAFNSVPTVGATLASIFRQTWANYEVIVVDDGSTDDLASAVAPYRDRIMLIRQPNAGAPAARNRGAEDATGEFMLFLDSDTVHAPDMLMAMAVALMTHPEVAYVYSDFQFGMKRFHLFDFSADKLRQTNYIHTGSLMRRQTFPGFDPTLKRFQDWDLWLSMLQHGQRGVWIPRRLFSVNQAHGTMSAWAPSFVYRLPLVGQGKGNQNIRRYREAEAIIKKKHHLA